VGADGEYWQLLDHEGRPLEDGDWAYAAWTGHDGQIDPPDAQGYPTGDDVKLPLSTERIEYASFLLVVATWERGCQDAQGRELHPVDGELIYCRIFDGPPGSIGPGSYYADSQLHAVTWKMGDIFHCRFPGDPGAGRTETPVPVGDVSTAPDVPGTVPELDLRQLYPHLANPAVELEYALPAAGPVSLRIYDVHGREVTVLADADREMGLYTERWDGGDLPAGIYIAVLASGDLEMAKKIVLLR
jgi:hypothetical protein